VEPFPLSGVCGGGPLPPAAPAAQEGLKVKRPPPNGRAPGPQRKVSKQTTALPPQALERPPLGRTISPSLFLSHRQFGCRFRHVASPHVWTWRVCGESILAPPPRGFFGHQKRFVSTPLSPR